MQKPEKRMRSWCSTDVRPNIPALQYLPLEISFHVGNSRLKKQKKLVQNVGVRILVQEQSVQVRCGAAMRVNCPQLS